MPNPLPIPPEVREAVARALFECDSDGSTETFEAWANEEWFPQADAAIAAFCEAIGLEAEPRIEVEWKGGGKDSWADTEAGRVALEQMLSSPSAPARHRRIIRFITPWTPINLAKEDA